jgi:hypothetical protein
VNSAFVVRGSTGCLIRREYGGSFTIMAGQRGAPGKSGAGASSTFVWPQNIPLTTWTIPHNLDRFPSVTVTDGQGRQVEPDITYVSSDIVQVTHGIPFAGVAYLN